MSTEIDDSYHENTLRNEVETNMRRMLKTCIIIAIVTLSLLIVGCGDNESGHEGEGYPPPVPVPSTSTPNDPGYDTNCPPVPPDSRDNSGKNPADKSEPENDAGHDIYTQRKTFTGEYGFTYYVFEGFYDCGTTSEEGRLFTHKYHHEKNNMDYSITETNMENGFDFSVQHEDAKREYLNSGASVVYEDFYGDTHKSYLSGYMNNESEVYYRLACITHDSFVIMLFEYPNDAKKTENDKIVEELVKSFIADVNANTDKDKKDELQSYSVETFRSKIVEHYTAKFQPEGTYVIFDDGNEKNSDTEYKCILRYQCSANEANAIIAEGRIPDANVYVTTVTVNKLTGDVTDEFWEPWHMD